MDLQELLSRLADLGALSDEDLVSLDTDLRAHAAELMAAATADSLAPLTQIAEAVEAIRTEDEGRKTRAAELAAQMAELAERIGPAATDTPPEPDAEPEPEPDEDEITEAIAEVVAEAVEITETAPEPVLVASAPPAVRTQRLAPLNRLASDTPKVPAQAKRAEMTLSLSPGVEVTMASLAKAMIAADKSAGSAYPGVRINIPVASVHANYEQDRQLDGFDDYAKIMSVVGPEALTAAGGICAPVTPYYGSEVIATDMRPVRDFLTGFQAVRGGIAFNRPYTLSNFSGAITNHTMLADENGSAKNCLALTCNPIVEEVIGAIVACVKFGNFQGRFNPETVAAALQLARANWARTAETILLDALRASQNYEVVTIALGAVADILYSVGAGAAGYRSRNRMAPDATLDVLLPAWVIAALQGDLARQPMGELAQFGQAEAGIRGWLAARNVRAGFYIDSPTAGTSQIFGAQPGGGLLDYPETVQWGLWHPGAHLFLDGGELNLGIVRDSVLNSTNDYEVFEESFEGHAFVGVESLWVEQTFCPSGAQSLPKDITGLCGGPYVPGS